MTATTHLHDHDHDHTHDHDHDHEHPAPDARPEPALPPSGDGTVVLDIGEGFGALVVHTSDALSGREVELARRGEHRQFVHTEVRERRLAGGSVYAGVFPAVAAGEYTLLGLDGGPAQDLTITSGSVTELEL